MSKQRNKKHNPNQRAVDFFNSKFRVWTWESEAGADGTQVAYAQKHMGTFWRAVNTRITGAVLARPQNWSICIRALCWTGQGNPWVEEATVTCRDTKLQDLQGIYEQYRAEVLAACQRRHVYDFGWMAQTFGKRDPADSDRWAMLELGEVTEARRNSWHFAQEQETEKAA